jgi:hypothetical protein
MRIVSCKRVRRRMTWQERDVQDLKLLRVVMSSEEVAAACGKLERNAVTLGRHDKVGPREQSPSWQFSTGLLWDGETTEKSLQRYDRPLEEESLTF